MFNFSLAVQLLIILAIVVGLMVASILISRRHWDYEKLSAYECGFEPVGNARIKFDVIYYVIGILFLLFDLEVVLLFPFALVIFQFESFFAFGLVLFFLVLLTLGFIYEWTRGALKVIRKRKE